MVCVLIYLFIYFNSGEKLYICCVRINDVLFLIWGDANLDVFVSIVFFPFSLVELVDLCDFTYCYYLFEIVNCVILLQ